MEARSNLSRKADDWRQLLDIDSFSRPFHGLRREIPLVPAMNRRAIISRPLTRTGTEAPSCAKPV